LASQQSNHKPKPEDGQTFILGVTSKNQVSEKHPLPTNFRQSSAGMSIEQLILAMKISGVNWPVLLQF